MSPQEIAEAVAKAVREAIETAQPLPPKLLFTAEEAHEITGLPASFFERESSHGNIPSRWIPATPGSTKGYRRYSLADLEAIVAEHGRQPTSGPMARTARRSRAA